LSCTPRPECVSPCGERLYGSSDCADLSTTEGFARTAFQDNVPGWSSDRTCRSMKNLDVDIMASDAGDWYDPELQEEVAGEDIYWQDEILVGMEPDGGLHGWTHSAYVHELGHQFQYDFDGVVDFTHSTWWDAGIYPAIYQVYNMGP
jgi:hypothetical protein